MQSGMWNTVGAGYTLLGETPFDSAVFYNQYDKLSVVSMLPAPAGSFVGPLQFTNGADADTYGVEIQPGQNDIVILAATAAIDSMAHPGR